MQGEDHEVDPYPRSTRIGFWCGAIGMLVIFLAIYLNT